MSELRDLCKSQMATIYDEAMSADDSLVFIMAAGKVNDVDYLRHLIDDYDRSRVRHLKKFQRGKVQSPDLEISKWAVAEKHEHFRQLKGLKVRVPHENGNSVIACEEVVLRYLFFWSDCCIFCQT